MPRRRNHPDDVLLLHLACGATAEAAAQKAGRSQRTVFRRLADPDFQRRLRELRADMLQRTAGMLTAAALEAVKTMVALLATNVPSAVRLAAARSVLELGLKVREAQELDERIAALEAQLAAPPTRPALGLVRPLAGDNA